MSNTPGNPGDGGDAVRARQSKTIQVAQAWSGFHRQLMKTGPKRLDRAYKKRRATLESLR